MSISKKIIAFAAVSALTAATAVPAMALENEFHGIFRVRGIASNFDDAGLGAVTIGGQPGATNGGKNPPTYSYIEQSARLMYTAKANDNLKLVTQFEIDSRWGDSSYNQNVTNNIDSSSTRNGGGGIGARQVNLETRNVYLDFNIPSSTVNVKAGIQAFTDNYKGIIFNDDAAGLTASGKCGKFSVQGGYFRFDDAINGATAAGNSYLAGTNPSGVDSTAVFTGAAGSPNNNLVVGNRTRDFATLGGKMNVSKDLVVGADYYLLYSDVLRATQDKTFVNMIGVNAETKIGPATVNGFAIYQTGELATPTLVPGQGRHQGLNAFAGNLAAKMPVGPGLAKITALYVSGDSNTDVNGGDRNDFQTIMDRGTNTAGHSFFEANSQLLFRNVYATDRTDRAVVFDLNNNGRGVIAVFAGYDLLFNKLFINSNIGMGAVAKNNSANTVGYAGGVKGTSDLLGTELNTEIGYKVYDNLTASISAAYMVLGDFYNGPTGTPDNPYSTKLSLNYTF